jgi:hypothetical protein
LPGPPGRRGWHSPPSATGPGRYRHSASSKRAESERPGVCHRWSIQVPTSKSLRASLI